jgi:hypothetical protein
MRVLGHPLIEEILTAEATFGRGAGVRWPIGPKATIRHRCGVACRRHSSGSTVPRAVYASSLAEARKRSGRRDPDDVELLALAIQLKLPVWSTDSDFKSTGVLWHTTASLLAALESK